MYYLDNPHQKVNLSSDIGLIIKKTRTITLSDLSNSSVVPEVRPCTRCTIQVPHDLPSISPAFTRALN